MTLVGSLAKSAIRYAAIAIMIPLFYAGDHLVGVEERRPSKLNLPQDNFGLFHSRQESIID